MLEVYNSLLFLLVKLQPFSWSDKLFSYYSLTRGVLYSIGMILCPLLLSFVHWLGKDSLMILFGIAASALSFVLIAYAQSTTVIFYDNSLLFLLVKLQPFSWSDKLFSYYSLTRGVLYSIGMILCPLLLSFVHWLGKDSLMILFGIAASALSFVLIAYAQSTTVIFYATGLTILCGGIAPGYRSFLPRMVSKEQTARLLTICSIIMAFCPMMSAVIFNSIFYMTIHWWPGFTFFVGGLLQLLVVVGQSAIHLLMRPQWLLEKKLRDQIVAHSMTVGEDDDCSDLARSVSTIVVDLNENSHQEEERSIDI
ncbi:hypothetical protein DICVIV_02361 [Dictyocaulus viviparus]|uniref:Major facilitator superfamily (MFS) profile domain-containing protein n=1 Tax=Dictyocaulus viviparus TaxID=29172 RepID=A0A0D8Y403_DICVI|nr:hypothetical protein DICVIV_02361 [Dictyocaulus viviparus]